MTGYRTIVADPPWTLANHTMGQGGRRARSTAVPYSFMSDAEIAALNVEALAADDAVLFLWSTRKRFREGIAASIARAWGFEPAGEIIWGLRNPGMGGILGNGHEPILIAQRGSSLLPAHTLPGSVMFWKQPYVNGGKQHSAKPGRIPRLRGVDRARAPARAIRAPAAARLGHVGKRSTRARRPRPAPTAVMAEPRYLLKPGDDAYGRVCPECASPKHRQSQRCAACYYAARRRGEYPPPPIPKRRTSASVHAGGSRGRPQPQSHPWRTVSKVRNSSF